MKEQIQPKGLSNIVALTLVLIGYPIGALMISLGYIVIEKKGAPFSIAEPANIKQNTQLSQADAINIVKDWWSKREKIMAPPYDSSLASDVIADGPLWNELNRDGGSVQWLKANKQYYEYRSTDIKKVVSYAANQDRPSLVIKVRSVLYLKGPNLNKKEDSTSDFKYIFGEENGKWKLWDYNQLKN